MLNIEKLKSRLNSLSNTNQKSNLIWKPKPGKQVVRIVPYKFDPENPFIELKFHYNINGKTYLSPDSFGRPDPIVEFSNRLKKSGSKDDWKMGRNMEPKMRTFAPVVVRNEENEGVKFWGFGKQVYQELLSIISDPDFGDITDLTGGRDIVVEFKTADDSGKSFPETNIRVKPNVSNAVDGSNPRMIEMLKNQVNILELFPELSYDELAEIMNKWLNPEEENEGDDLNPTSSNTEDEDPTSSNTEDREKVVVSPSAQKAKEKSSSDDDVEKQFADLFNS